MASVEFFQYFCPELLCIFLGIVKMADLFQSQIMSHRRSKPPFLFTKSMATSSLLLLLLLLLLLKIKGAMLNIFSSGSCRFLPFYKGEHIIWLWLPANCMGSQGFWWTDFVLTSSYKVVCLALSPWTWQMFAMDSSLENLMAHNKRRIFPLLRGQMYTAYSSVSPDHRQVPLIVRHT